MKLSCFFLDEKQVNEKRFSTAGDGLKLSIARFLYHIEEEWKRERVEAEPAIDEFSYWVFSLHRSNGALICALYICSNGWGNFLAQ